MLTSKFNLISNKILTLMSENQNLISEINVGWYRRGGGFTLFFFGRVQMSKSFNNIQKEDYWNKSFIHNIS